MASGLELGERRLPSTLDATLAASPIVSAAYTAPLLGVGITNGDFSIANNQDANYSWQTNGATTISNGVATLSDTSKQLANLTQKFLIPTNANTLQFTIKNSQLRSGQTNATPNDSFEVALLDAQMNPLAGKAQGLANTDSLLNLQADGTIYFSDKVKIGGVTTSGGKIANTDERTVTIDLAGIAGNTEAMLYFDLLSFGSGASHVTIDNVKVFTQAAPQLQNANLATNQATGLDIPLPNGVTFNSIELGTQPQHGTVIRNPLDGKITYTPKSDYVGTDSFTYLGFSPDGQISNPATINITVNNVAPKIDSVVIPPTVKEGQNVQLQATASDGGSSSNLTYSWNLGDGSNPIVGQNIAHTFADNGTYNVTLTVTDKDGGISQQTTQVLVDNVAPTVNITAPVNAIDQGGSVQFGVNYSDPGIKDTHTITWNFDDGTTPVTGVTNPNHLFTTVGNRNVTVTVTDNDGASTTQSLQIAVNNVAPTINSIDIPTNINEGQLVQLTATASDPGNDALTYNWYVNNATTPIVGQTINYTFADNGVYPVKLNVIDSNGAIITQSVEVTVNNVAPIIVAIVKPDKINEGELVEFRAVSTDVGINDTLTYTWNFGDNTSLVSGQKVNHVFTDNGNYNITLTVKDKDGSSTTQTTSVKVDNIAPIIVSILKPELIKEGQQVEFQATATDAGINDNLTYNWNFGDNTNPVVGQNATHTFADNGNYNVVLTVTDKDGTSTIQTTAVTVDNVAPSIISIAKPTQINEGQSVSFAATATDPGILDTLTYSWNFGDNTNPVIGQNATHTFADNGDYQVVLTLTDNDGAVTTQTVTAKVDNVAPTIVSIAKPTTIKEGESVTFTATATDPGILDTLTYSWNFGDNTNPVSGQNINHTFADNGNYNVVLTVTDKDGGITTQTVTAKVDNVAPTIVSIAKPPTIKEGESVTFTATATDPGILDTLIYSWNFGDNTNPVVGQNVNHTFADNGNYNVVLTVTDKDGGVTTQAVVAKVDNVAPTIVSIAKPATIKEGESVIFTATATDPGILDTLTYSWNFGDNTNAVSGQNVNHTFADNGNYNIVLTVTDKDGGVTTQTIVAKVDNVAPTMVLIAKPATIKEGESVIFTATATDPGILDTLTYTWNFGDNNSPVSGQNVNHTFADNGNYNVVLTVTDKDGGVTTQTIIAKVDNVAPTIASIVKPAQINEGQAVVFTATATDPGILDTLTYSWNFGDNTALVTGQNVTHTFADNGNYNVVLTVTDKDGAVTTQTVVAKVDNVAPTIVNITKPNQINEGQSVTFAATATDPGTKDTLTYSWNFGDNTAPVIGQTATHTFADNGNYNVILTVTDKDGGVTTQTVIAKVDNVAPTIVSIVKPTTINQNQAATFAATATDPGTLDTLTYAWNFGDNTQTATGATTAHTFTTGGSYTITLAVTDKDGATTTTTQQITVAALPTITINDSTITEGNSGTTNITFTITLSQASTQAVSVNYNTSNITALSGSDYTATSGAITFAAGETTKTITIAILGDTIAESTETFALNLTNAINATITRATGTATILDSDIATTANGIRSGGTVSISGNANLDGNTSSRTDDTHIYAAKGVNLNGNITLPVKRDAAGNPLKDANGKVILETNEITVAPGGSTSSLTGKYSNIASATQTITIPTYTDTKQQDFLSKVPTTGVITYDIGLNPIGNTATWNTKFPPDGTATNPTVVRIINGSLNLPANINLSNYIIIVENGNINFSQGNPVINNVTLIANAGNINLKSVTGTSLSLCASGDINFSGANQLAGNNVINSNGNAHLTGSTLMTNTASQVKIVAQGNIEISGNTSLKGQLWTKKDFSANGSTTIVGAITAMDNVDISGNSTITG
jgi:large repetitive protein